MTTGRRPLNREKPSALAEGVFTTTPLRTLIDIDEEGRLSHDLLVQALKEALRKGILSRKDIENTPASCKLKKLLRMTKISAAKA